MTSETQALAEAIDILKGKLSSFPDHGARDGVAVYNIRLNGAQLAALLDERERMVAALSLVRMSRGWQYLADETRQLIEAALNPTQEGSRDHG